MVTRVIDGGRYGHGRGCKVLNLFEMEIEALGG